MFQIKGIYIVICCALLIADFFNYGKCQQVKCRNVVIKILGRNVVQQVCTLSRAKKATYAPGVKEMVIGFTGFCDQTCFSTKPEARQWYTTKLVECLTEEKEKSPEAFQMLVTCAGPTQEVSCEGDALSNFDKCIVGKFKGNKANLIPNSVIVCFRQLISLDMIDCLSSKYSSVKKFLPIEPGPRSGRFKRTG